MLTSTAANVSPLLDRKIEETSAAERHHLLNTFVPISEDNAATIIEYIAAMKSEVNLSDNYRKDLIELLSRYSKYNDNKPFKHLVRTNIIGFLETYRKTEAADPMHKWIGTYTLSGFICSDFSNGYIILISNPIRGLNLQ